VSDDREGRREPGIAYVLACLFIGLMVLAAAAGVVWLWRAVLG